MTIVQCKSRALKVFRCTARRGFSLIELSVVLGIIMLLGVLSAPVAQNINGAGSVSKAAGDLAGLVEQARTYAMATHTYVRVAFGETTSAGNGGALVVLPVYSADGTLLADGPAAMADARSWPAMVRPLVIENFTINNDLNAQTPDTHYDTTLGVGDPAMTPFSRNVEASPVNFSMVVQFSPAGEASVVKGVPARYIKIGVEKSNNNHRNPFILRLSGANGNVSILRKENM